MWCGHCYFLILHIRKLKHIEFSAFPKVLQPVNDEGRLFNPGNLPQFPCSGSSWPAPSSHHSANY